LYPTPAQLKFEAFVSEAFPTCDILLAFGGIIYLLEPKGGGGGRSVGLFLLFNPLCKRVSEKSKEYDVFVLLISGSGRVI
jgi:hypothetical protein